MSNTIQIKRGDSVPGNNVLSAYELGYVTSKGQLYIGLPKEGVIQATPLKYVPLVNGTAANLTVGAGYLTVGDQASDRGYVQISSEKGNYSFNITNLTDGWNRGFYFNYVNSNLERKNMVRLVMGGTGTKAELLYVQSGENDTVNTWLKVNSEGLLTCRSLQVKNYGTVDPNTAEIPGVAGQLYFVLAE